jgi:hypothetical protein
MKAYNVRLRPLFLTLFVSFFLRRECVCVLAVIVMLKMSESDPTRLAFYKGLEGPRLVF